MKLISWNVNGIRAVMKKDFLNFVKKYDPDILCLQETKVDKSLANIKIPGYEFVYWDCAMKKGYSGTAIFSKIKAINNYCGVGLQHHDKEGRVVTLEFEEFYLVNVYTPNSQRGLTRLKYRQEWDRDFLDFIKKLETKKPVIFCGDLNVAHQEIDIKNAKANVMNAGFTKEERADFDNILKMGFIDSFRFLHPGLVKYSWWSYMFNARINNVGWRIDYFIVSNQLRKKIKGVDILNDVFGSDHCPVTLEIDV